MTNMTTAKRGAPRRNEIQRAELSLRAAALMGWIVNRTGGARDSKAFDAYCRGTLDDLNSRAKKTGNDPLPRSYLNMGKLWTDLSQSASGEAPQAKTKSTLAKLEKILPGASKIYDHGPDGLLDHVFGDPWDHPLMALRGLVPSQNTHDLLDDFSRYLDARQRNAAISLDDAVVAIRLYNLALSGPLARHHAGGGDQVIANQDQTLASPAYQLMCYCLDQPTVQMALDAYGINAPLRRYLEAVERDRVSRNKAAKRKIEEVGHAIGDPIETYVKDPSAFLAAVNRKPHHVSPRSIVAERQFLPRAWRSLHISRSDTRRVLISVLALLVLATASQIVTAHRLQAQIKTLNHELRATAHS